MSILAKRYHDISCGHRVVGHEGKCAHLHGHNYRIHFSCAGDLDVVGRVIDFSEIKNTLCLWLEMNWDHKFIVSKNDPWKEMLLDLDPKGVVVVPFNPTAENMAEYLVEVVCPALLHHTGICVVDVTIEETRKCSVQYSLKGATDDDR